MKLFSFHSRKESQQEETEGLTEGNLAVELKRLAGTITAAPEYKVNLERQIISKAQLLEPRQTLKDRSWIASLSPSYRMAVIVFAMITIVAIGILGSPSLRAAAQSLLSFWIKSDQNTQVLLPTAEVPVLEPTRIPGIVAEVETAMEATREGTGIDPLEKYTLKLPTRLPKGYSIKNIEPGPAGNAWVDLSNPSQGVLLTLVIRPADEVEGTIIGPENKVTNLVIGELSGEYVRGGWGSGYSVASQMKPEDIENQVWIDDAMVHKFRWNDGNLNYMLVYMGERQPGSPRYLGMNDMATIAASMEPVADGSKPALTTFEPDNGAGESEIAAIQDLEILRQLVGFHIPQSDAIPDHYVFSGGEVPFAPGIVFMKYTCKDDDPEMAKYGDFGIHVQINRMSETQYEKEMGNYMPYEIGSSALIEPVSINGISGEYLKGEWSMSTALENGTAGPQKRTWNNDIDYHRLHWYADGFLYRISTMGVMLENYQGLCKITKDALVLFAKGLK